MGGKEIPEGANVIGGKGVGNTEISLFRTNLGGGTILE